MLFQPSNIFAQEYVVGGDFDYAPFHLLIKQENPVDWILMYWKPFPFQVILKLRLSTQQVG
jgi:hypothetical protein